MTYYSDQTFPFIQANCLQRNRKILHMQKRINTFRRKQKYESYVILRVSKIRKTLFSVFHVNVFEGYIVVIFIFVKEGHGYQVYLFSVHTS